jgi:hypothetical protein
MTTLFYNSGKTSLYKFQKDNKEKIFDLTLDAIDECISDELDSLAFLTIQPDNTIYCVNRERFNETIQKAISFYESIEAYEKCSDCILILNKFK